MLRAPAHVRRGGARRADRAPGADHPRDARRPRAHRASSRCAAPEEMPVNETLALRDGAGARATGCTLALAVVNGCCPTASRRRGGGRARRRSRGIRRSPPRSAVTRGRTRSAPSSRGCGAASARRVAALPLHRRPVRDAAAIGRRLDGALGVAVCDRAGSPASGSSSAPAPAAWARRRRRRRSRWASPRAAQRVAVVTIDPARRLADSLGPRRARQRAARSSTRALRRPRRRDARRAVGDDARPQAHVRRADRRGSRPTTRRATRSSTTASTSSSPARSPARRSSRRSPSSTSSTTPARFDVLVLDTPPSRNALDFLDAPDRLTGFFEGRALQLFLAPDRASPRGRGPRHRRRLLASSGGVTGVDLLDDLSVFFRALGGVLDGFRERAGRRQGAARRPGDDVPHRHLAGARAGRGGDLLPPQAARGACRSAG